MNIGRLQCLCLQLAHSGVLVSNSFHLLLLDAWWSDIHSENDVLRLTHGQTCNVDIVLLSVVSKNQVLQLDFDMNPLLVS